MHNNDRNTLLHDAVSKNDIKEIDSLLKEGADIEATDEYGKTPLFVAVFQNNVELVTFLLEKGANTEAKDKNGNTPLNVRHVIISLANDAMIKLLLTHGAKVNTTDSQGETPLHKVVSASNYLGLAGKIEILLAYGADISAKNSDGQTPLDLANDQCKFLDCVERNTFVSPIVLGDKKLKEKPMSVSSPEPHL